MNKKLALIITVLLLVFSNALFASDVWPLNTGETWEYAIYPLDGSESSIIYTEVGEPVLLGGQWYYPFGDTHFRSTDTHIYEWDDSNGECLFFQIAPVGRTWIHNDNTAEIVDDDIKVYGVYGGPYNAYKIKFTDIGTPSETWYMYIVPGVGLVRVDEFGTDVPFPHIVFLTDVRTCNYSVVGDLDRNCVVDLNDLALIAQNWLLDCEQNPSNPDCIALQ